MYPIVKSDIIIRNVKQLIGFIFAVISPIRTKFLQDFIKGKCALLARDVESLYKALSLVSAKPIPENDQVQIRIELSIKLNIGIHVSVLSVPNILMYVFIVFEWVTRT